MQVKTCCGCWSLKTGSIVVAIINMSLMLAVMVIMAIATSDVVERAPISDARAGPYYVMKSATVAAIAYLLIAFSVSILLIVGAIKRNDKYVFPFVCLTFVSLIISVSAAIGHFSFLISWPYTPIQVFLLVSAIIAVILAIHYYMWLVPYSFYHQLVNERFGHSGIKSSDGVIYSKQSPIPYMNDV